MFVSFIIKKTQLFVPVKKRERNKGRKKERKKEKKEGRKEILWKWVLGGTMGLEGR